MAVLEKLKSVYGWANQHWPSVWLQSAAGLLAVFGVLCLLPVEASPEPSVFAIGSFFAFVQLFMSEESMRPVGAACLFVAAVLLVATVPSQKKQFARFRKDQAMLRQQDWRK